MSFRKEGEYVRAVIAAGGTGGHIYPGIALAEAMTSADPSCVVSFVGTPRGLESRLIPEAGFALDLVNMLPFSGRYKLRIPFSLARSVVQARKILKRTRATVVAGMGGYASLPLIIAARTAGIPCLIHESGATLGRANLVSARFTKNVGLAFPIVQGRLPKDMQARVVGMPLRREVAQMNIPELREVARREHRLTEGVTMILMFGGSQGAASINRLAVDLSMRWATRKDVAILLKTGPKQIEEVNAELQGSPSPITVTSFIERMDLAYAAADIVVSRAGAGTVAEVAIAGLPSILIPYPHAPGDHQRLNAAELLEVGAAFVVDDREATPDQVAPMIDRLIFDPSSAAAMRRAAASVARPRAAEELANWMLDISK